MPANRPRSYSRTDTRTGPPPPLSPLRFSLSYGYLHMLGTYTRTHTRCRCHCPALSDHGAIHPRPFYRFVCPLLSLPSLSFYYSRLFGSLSRLQLLSRPPPLGARHHAVQTPTQEQHAIVNPPKKKNILMQGGGQHGPARQSSCRLSPLVRSIDFLRSRLSFPILDKLMRRFRGGFFPPPPMLRTLRPFLRLNSAVLRPRVTRQLTAFVAPLALSCSFICIVRCERRNYPGWVATIWLK
ncbi:hypothetical protein V8C35DRAFT_26644 [Trichoderma chlorosporum]